MSSVLMRRRALVGAGVAALLAAAYGCSRRDDGPVEGASRLRIATPLVPHAGLIHLAAARGLFHEQGLAATLLPHTFGKAALADLLRGNADLAVAADVPVVVEVLKGAGLSIVASVANASNELAVLGRVDRGIRAPGDLRGRRLGVSLGTSGEYFLWAFLVRHRIAPQSVQLVDLAPAQLIESLRSGQVDGIAAWQPVRHDAERAFGDAIVSLHAPDAYVQSYVLVGMGDFVQARQQEMRRLLHALMAAEAAARADPRQAKGVLAGLFKLSPETLDPSWQDLTLEVEQNQAQLVTLEDVATWAMARGYAPPQTMPNFLSHLALDPLLAVGPERVTVVR
ncbi:ABC transporter substrate-binding protein [Pelomonas sp. KK5]|uniref:ABC transporter substrate-binding protein n=1 Tax=Pelomonas sp. KK5 TaxID=1855730 RepID=UPI0009FADF47|nr:ABC transporter substrate-binding protein [Pelomonas sp. KK5]